MEPADANIDNISRMESDDDNVGLSDIIDILNTLDNQSIDINGASTAQTEPQMNVVLTSLMGASSPTSPTNMQSPILPQGAQQNLQNKSAPKPFINIVEQPATKALRFRYKCEGRSAGSIPGLNSTPENKTYPTIEIVGYKGDVVIVVSCVTKDPPYRQHPHYLVGKDGCKDGICTLVLSGEPLRAVFSNLGIQCVKKNDIKAALEVRERLQVDPFKTKFGHKDQPASIDLNVVRLCFQAFLKTGSVVKPLQPVVSEPVYDKKAMSDLVICRLCCCSAKVGGGDEIILLCEKIAKDDIKIIKIRFYELSNDNQLIWEDFAEFQPTDIHKQTAIAFKTPRYHNQDVLEKANVFIQLVRPSDGVQSESLPFEYHPDPDQIKRKRLKTGGNPMNILRRELQKYEKQQNAQFQNDIKDIPNATNNNFWNTPMMPDIKAEPVAFPQHFGAYRSPYQMSPSPQPVSPMNRNSTPSPGLMKTFSGSSQTQMSEMFNMGAMREQTSPIGYMQQQQQQQQQQQLATQQQQRYLNENPLKMNGDTCDSNKFTTLEMSNHNFMNNTNGNGSIITNRNLTGNGNGDSQIINSFINHLANAPTTCGGSITPLWSVDDNANMQNVPLFQNLVMPVMQQQQPQQQLQQQQQQHQSPVHEQNQQHQHQHQHQPLQNTMNFLPNVTGEEGTTLSGLLAFVDGENFVNFTSDDLPLSNLSITT